MPTDIDTMSGPDISKCLAVELMGWEWTPDTATTVGYFQTPDGILDDHQWQPHTDRNDAYRVLERIKALLLDDIVSDRLMDAFYA